VNAASVRRLIQRARTTCVVYKRTPGSDDGYYAPAPGNYAAVVDGSHAPVLVPCVVAPVPLRGSSGEQFTPEGTLVIDSYLVYLPWDADVTEDDELRDFLARGADATIGALNVKAVVVTPPFLREARCQVVR
jgi:hypothetical protein